MTEVVSIVFPLFGIVLLGFASGRFVGFTEEGLDWLHFFVLYCAMPALFFQFLSATPIERIANWGFVFGTAFSTYVAFALAFCVGVLATGGQIRQATMQALAGSYSNVAYLGPGLALTVLGTSSTVPVALVFCFDTMLLGVMAALLMAIGDTERHHAMTYVLAALRKVFLHPLVIATILGVIAAAFNVRPPAAVDRFLALLGAAAAPGALFALGVSVAFRPRPRFAREVPALLGVKLILHPLIAYTVLTWLGGLEPMWIAAAMLTACLPPAANVILLARRYNTYVDGASNVVVVGTAASAITITVLLALLYTGRIPGL